MSKLKKILHKFYDEYVGHNPYRYIMLIFIPLTIVMFVFFYTIQCLLWVFILCMGYTINIYMFPLVTLISILLVVLGCICLLNNRL